jgi:gliding motility-associated-like protein
VNVPHEIFIPNIFTPNGDGYNDTFFIEKLHLFPFNEINVWNRNGKKVFGAKNYKGNWDGHDLPSGTYYYQLILSRLRTYKGWIQINR